MTTEAGRPVRVIPDRALCFFLKSLAQATRRDVQ